MNSKRNILFISLIAISIINFYPVHSLSSETNLVSLWEITEWNEASVVAWEYPTLYFTAKNGSNINYTISSYDSANFTNPSSGVINIGNLTTQTTNNKTGEVLTLSIWGWFPGLITSSDDWNLQKQVAQEAAQGQWTTGNLEIQELTYNYAGMLRKAINFTYQQDPNIGNQNTTLIYDMDTGVLLEGYTELKFFELYVLELILVNSDLIVKVNTNLTSQHIFTNLTTIVFVGLLWGLLRKKK